MRTLIDIAVDPKLSWYLTRSSGLVLLVLFTASTGLGILSSVATAGGRVPRFVATDLHRRISLLSLIFLVLHVATAIADNFVEITWFDALIPFKNDYRTLYLGLGTFAADILLAVMLSSLLRHRIELAAWRSIHLLSYAMWPMVILHGLGTGADSKKVPVIVLTAVCVVSVVGLVTWRVMLVPASSQSIRVARVMVLPVVALALAVWAVAGPLAPGWSKKAGTPPPVSKPAAASTTAGHP